MRVLSVSEITGQIKETLEDNFQAVSVLGEISNFKAHVSGHWYFTLKDENSQISCTMWRGFNNHVFFTPRDGMKITANGSITVYPPRGNYQFDVRSMKPAGEGELQAAFEALKRKLADEGLFEVEHKKPIGRFPKKIGIVTASGGAALRDMINIAQRRYPIVELVIAPSKVQGEGAADDIAYNIKALNDDNEVDVIIVGRGGGSLEDLWAFNEEIVAKAIFNSKIPVISGVGHEIDFTIADFVADLRAPTPSAAMELATPNKDEIFAFINEFSYNSFYDLNKKIQNNGQMVNNLIHSYGFRQPENKLKNKNQQLDHLLFKIDNSRINIFKNFRRLLELYNTDLRNQDVNRILKKGFTVISQNGKYVTRGKELSPKESFKIKFFDKDITIN